MKDLIERQHGVVARRQLLELGLGRGAIDHRLGTGRLHSIYRGVYAVGHRSVTAHGRWMAAVLAAGDGAVLSHRAAASAWGMLRSHLLEATVRKQQRPRRGLLLRRFSLEPDEISEVEGIPVTGVSRTLLDLAAVLPRRHVERAMDEAEVRKLTDCLSLPDLLARYPRRPGTPVIRAILASGAVLTRSELEARFLDFLEARDFTRPETNARILARGNRYETDALWRAQRLVIELDGRTFHDTAAAFERDRARDRRLHAEGWRVIRVTWLQLREEPETLARDLWALLGRPCH